MRERVVNLFLLFDITLQPGFQILRSESSGAWTALKGDFTIHSNSIEPIRPCPVGAVDDIIVTVNQGRHGELQQGDTLLQVF